MDAAGSDSGIRVLVLDGDDDRRPGWRSAIANLPGVVATPVWTHSVHEAHRALRVGIQHSQPFDLIVLGAGETDERTGEQGTALLQDFAARFPDAHLIVAGHAEELAALDLQDDLVDRVVLVRSPLLEAEVRQTFRMVHQVRNGIDRTRRLSPVWSAYATVSGDEAERNAQDARLLRALMDNLGDVAYVKDTESRLIRCNRRMAQWIGKGDPANLLGKTDREIFDEEHFRQTRPLELEVMNSGRAEGIVREDDPGRFSVRVPLTSPEGEVTGIFGVSFRVPAVGELIRELRDDQHLFQTLLEATPDRIYFKDLQSRITRASQAMAQMHDMAKDELIGKTDAELFLPEHAEKALADERQIIATGEPVLNTVEKETMPDGSIKWCLTSKAPLRDAAGEIIGTFGISKDITALKEAEHELELTHRKLVETSRRAGMAEVATGVLHNVGNVLNSVNVSASMISDRLRRSRVTHLPKLAQLLAEHEPDLARFIMEDPSGRQLPGYVAKLAEAITDEHQRQVSELDSLRRNVEHIKDIVAMQQNYAQVSGVIETVPIVDLIEDALAINAAGLDRHGVHLRRDFRAAPVVCVDKHKVLQILVNLISNAKYACDASARPDRNVVLTLDQPDADRVRVVVTDNGVGIAPEHMDKLFSHGFTTKKHGHGFGLHNSALAARELQGTLHAASDGPGRGATFTFEMPLGQGVKRQA